MRIRDVSARVQAESDLRYRIQLLERLFNSSPIGLLLSDASSGRLLEANPAFLQQCGWRSDELLRRGGFGSPSMFVAESLYFGHDRLPLVEAALLHHGDRPFVAPGEHRLT